MTRAEKVKRAQALRAKGLSIGQIAQQMHVARSTVGTWLADPDLSKQWARRARYSKSCPSCGEPMDGSGGYAKQHEMCQSCREWPREAIINAVQTWADEHGGLPPTCEAWLHSGPDHPSATTVENRLGWNNALLQAGFGLYCDRRPETQEWIVAQLRAGASTQSIADALGVTLAAIHMRMNYRGLRVSEVRAA